MAHSSCYSLPFLLQKSRPGVQQVAALASVYPASFILAHNCINHLPLTAHILDVQHPCRPLAVLKPHGRTHRKGRNNLSSENKKKSFSMPSYRAPLPYTTKQWNDHHCPLGIYILQEKHLPKSWGVWDVTYWKYQSLFFLFSSFQSFYFMSICMLEWSVMLVFNSIIIPFGYVKTSRISTNRRRRLCFQYKMLLGSLTTRFWEIFHIWLFSLIDWIIRVKFQPR